MIHLANETIYDIYIYICVYYYVLITGKGPKHMGN